MAPVRGSWRAPAARVVLGSLLSASSWLVSGCATRPAADEVPVEELRSLEPAPGAAYRTPRAGEGFRTAVFGESVAVQPRDRRAVTAWDLGLDAVAPGRSEADILPFASLFLWRRTSDDHFLRAVLSGLYNEVYYSHSTEGMRPLEWVLTFNSFTVPFELAENVDGRRVDAEELVWGYVRPGLGLGLRDQLERPGHNDNMAAASLTFEPGLLYSDSGLDTTHAFIEPADTFEGRGHLQLRLDILERNLLELPHDGLATGADFFYGFRARWKDWGVDARERAASGRDYATASAYILRAGGVPLVQSDRHRLLISLHGGVGEGLDRFSEFRVGGGPMGEEYEALARPVLPGAMIEEFQTRRYAILVGEYRWELVFFTYLSVRSSLSYVERDRYEGVERTRRDDLLGSIGLRITTGLPLDLRLQLDYNYSEGVVRRDAYGGHEVMAHLSGAF